jgi:hypothetical protein
VAGRAAAMRAVGVELLLMALDGKVETVA